MPACLPHPPAAALSAASAFSGWLPGGAPSAAALLVMVATVAATVGTAATEASMVWRRHALPPPLPLVPRR